MTIKFMREERLELRKKIFCFNGAGNSLVDRLTVGAHFFKL